ncbi:MAG: 8-amino-7-oxononanoate synthase [Solirubrobacterales bacterium]
MTDVAQRLAELEDADLRRELRTVGGSQGRRVLLDGREVLLLCSNNYLGLANHPAVTQAAAAAARRWGTGAGASRLISGTMIPHEELEAQLADFHGFDRALLFGSGYLANLGTISALAERGRRVYSDELNHASIVDGCRLARAETVIYRHADVEHLGRLLAQSSKPGDLIVTDGVFSMDGDVAPLREIVALAQEFGARLLVDEAHATGTVGPGGRGTVAAAGLEDEVDVIVGTLGKALGSYGAYVCSHADVAELLINVSRRFIYSTALTPPQVAAAAAALAILQECPDRTTRLHRNAAHLRGALADAGLDVSREGAHIVPVMAGESGDAVALSEQALAHAVYAQAIRPPTVPAGTARLRLTVMSTHRPSELTAAALAVGAAAAELGIGAGSDSARAPGPRHHRSPTASEPRANAEMERASRTQAPDLGRAA